MLWRSEENWVSNAIEFCANLCQRNIFTKAIQRSEEDEIIEWMRVSIGWQTLFFASLSDVCCKQVTCFIFLCLLYSLESENLLNRLREVKRMYRDAYRSVSAKCDSVIHLFAIRLSWSWWAAKVFGLNEIRKLYFTQNIQIHVINLCILYALYTFHNQLTMAYIGFD